MPQKRPQIRSRIAGSQFKADSQKKPAMMADRTEHLIHSEERNRVDWRGTTYRPFCPDQSRQEMLAGRQQSGQRGPSLGFELQTVFN
jgi:hypothetical protein